MIDKLIKLEEDRMFQPQELIYKELGHYIDKQEHFYQNHKMSHQAIKIPKDLMPSTEKGNYSLRINENKHGFTHTRDVKQVNNWVSYHMRDHNKATDTLLSDLVVFEDYAKFDYESIHTIQTKNKVESFVNEIYNAPSIDGEYLPRPTYEQLKCGYRD